MMLIKPNGAVVEHTILLNVRRMGTHAFIVSLLILIKRNVFFKNSITADNDEMVNYYLFHSEKPFNKHKIPIFI